MRSRMFPRLTTTKYLKVLAGADAAEVAFLGGEAAGPRLSLRTARQGKPSQSDSEICWSITGRERRRGKHCTGNPAAMAAAVVI